LRGLLVLGFLLLLGLWFMHNYCSHWENKVFNPMCWVVP